MKTYLILAALFFAPFTMQAQLGKLLNKAKDKVAQRADNRADKEMDKALDKVEGKGTTTTPATTETTSTTTAGESTGKPAASSSATAQPTTVKAYSKFDFVPGEKVLYAEDFTQDAVGEMPLKWNSSGKGEVVTIDGQKGKWLRMTGGTNYLTGNRKNFGENYTIEFDMMQYFQPKVNGYLLPGWNLFLLSSGKEDGTGNFFLKASPPTHAFVDFNVSRFATAKFQSRVNSVRDMESDKVSLGDATQELNKVHHYAIQVQKTRFRMWMNGTKIFDLPRGLPASDTVNQLSFRIDESNYTDEEVGFFLSNLKIATGLPDARRKLVEEGKFSTTGILFDVNAATIKPESAGVLKEIATILKENSDIKIKIVGHTDSDGADAANLELSKKRAAEVKATLVKDYAVDETRITTDGKGEATPAGDNKTPEGKAQNRRVEFLKV